MSVHHPHPRRIRWQWRVAYLLGALALFIPVYALWPVAVTTFPDQPQELLGSREVEPGATVQWISHGTTCFPDGWVLVKQTVHTALPDGSPFLYPAVGPLFNRGGDCVEDNRIAYQLPTNVVLPGPFTVEFQFCSNPGRWLRERCVTRYSPEFVLVSDFHPTVNEEGDQ